MRAPVIPDGTMQILWALNAGIDTTSGIRDVIGKDPHPTLGRDVIERGWAEKIGPRIELTEIGLCALELGTLERKRGE